MQSLFFRYFLFVFIGISSALFSTNAPNIQYIVLLSADGPLGTDLNNYWEAVKDSDLDHEAISKYPPHCTITSFFHPTQPASYYLNIIQQAISSISSTPYVTVTSYIQHDKTLDYLILTSSYLTTFGLKFLQLAGLPRSFVKGPKGTTGFTFHITLRDKTFDKSLDRLQRIHDVQDENIDPRDNAGWFIGLYIKENDNPVQLYGQPIRIVPGA
jgi:hypothetical protein